MRLQPFLDGIVLRGMDPDHIGHLRDQSLADQITVLRNVSGKGLSREYPSTVWRKHMGTGAHIARTRVHTELGQLGPDGVDMALALAAQRDARTSLEYQATQVARAQRVRGQEMMDGLLAEAFDYKGVKV
jgi:hypothetical protein